MQTSGSISKKLERLNIPTEGKELIVENGVRYRILELEGQLKKIREEVELIEGSFGETLQSLEKKVTR